MACRLATTDNSKPVVNAIAPLKTILARTTSEPAAAVAAPTLPAAQPGGKSAPDVRSREERAEDEALEVPIRQMYASRLATLTSNFEKRIASAPDDETRNRFQQMIQDQENLTQKWLTLLSDPPEKIGEIETKQGPARTFTLSTGKTITVDTLYQYAENQWQVVLSQEIEAGGTSNHSVTPTFGKPMIALLYDGTPVKFTPLEPGQPPIPLNSPDTKVIVLRPDTMDLRDSQMPMKRP